jgi:gliding motility-associated-like protein
LVFEKMRSLFIYILLILPIICFSQECQWVETQNNSSGEVMTTCVATDKNNNVVVGGMYRTNNLNVGNVTLTNPNNGFLAKYNSEGDLLWTVSIRESANAWFSSFVNVEISSTGDIFAIGTFYSDSLHISSNITLLNLSTDAWAKTNLFIVKYDSLGNALWAKNFYNPQFQLFYNLSQWNNLFSFLKPSLIIDNNNNPIICIESNRDIVFSDTSLVLSSAGAGFALIKYSTNGNYLFAQDYRSLEGISTLPNLCISKNGNMNISLLIQGEYSLFQDTLNKGATSSELANAILILDSSGQYIKGRLISKLSSSETTGGTPSNTITTIDNQIVCVNTFRSNTTIDSIALINNNNVRLKYIAYFNENLDLIRVRQMDSNSTSNSRGLGITSSSNNVYFSGFMDRGSLSIGGITLTNSTSNRNLFIVKMDTLENVLWAFSNDRSTANSFDITTDTRGDVYVVGNYNDSIHIFNKSAGGSTTDGYVAKITDYSITRGEVFAGPYCAGDSILIPYTRMGPFEPDNEFIAELSDENGNFDGGQRELGRLKTTEDSTIIGALPLFEVSSSANYRIRIRSTHPPVQSFFRRDSLRLLIYSRDKADPGPPETVCFGDSFRLNTFGGTAWEWSPAYRMDNPNARSPLIYPDRDTLFRIVISDSSGCGEPDTAFKQIYIRTKAQIQTQTLVNACWGLPVNLSANFTQGDSSQYRWTWFSTQNPTAWVPLQSDSFRTNDTFTFNYPQSNVNRRFALVLEDDCQTIKDTALITVRLSPHRISSILSTQDSIICYQSHQNLIANISGGDSATYQWQWFEVDAMGEFIFLKEDSVRFNDTLQVQLRPESKEFQRYALVSNDNCIPFFDTAYLNVNINPHQPQAAILPADTAICPSTEVELVGQVNNGSALGYAFVWLDETNTILQSDTGFSPQIFSLTPDFSGGQSERMYRLIAQDLCSPNADTAQTRITPLEPLQAIPITLDTTVCSGQELSLSANGLGGVSTQYQYQWILNNNIISSDSDVGFIPPINPSPFTIQLVLTDNCMPQNDTADITVRVKPALQSVILREPQDDNEPHQDHAVQDTTVCSGSELRFFAKALGGDSTNYSYEWLWNDSLMGTQKELLFVPIHPSPSTLHLISKDGCTVPNDTTSVTINILPPLNVPASLSGAGALPDTLCSGEETQLFAQAFGGDSSNDSFEWLLNDSLIATGSDVVVRLSNHHPSPSTLQLILSDGCSSPNDTFVHTFIIRPALAIDLFASTPCANPTTTITANPSGGNLENYIVQWFDEVENVLGEGLSIEVTPTRLTTYKAILTDDCSQTQAEAQIQIDLIPSILELTASPTQGCEPLPVDFEVNTNYSNTFIYTLLFTPSDSSQSLPPTNPPLSFTYTQGIYTPTLILTTQLGCDTTLTGPIITIHPKPTAAFSFSPEEPDLDNNSVQFRNLSTGANSYVWNISPFGNFTEAEPNVIYTDSGFHPLQLIAISDQDCRDTVQGQVYIRTNYRVYIPNVFSPNGDGKNDLFRPAMRGFAESDLNIYNRWGERLFQSRDNTGWDGTYRGQPVPDGVYMYTLSVLNLFGERQFFNGTVTLVR